jgi:hypothetical protein
MALFIHQKRPLPNENQAKVSQNNVMLPIKPGILSRNDDFIA